MAYQYQEYPKWKFHHSKPAVIVSNKASEDALGPDWYNSPADVKPPEPAPISDPETVAKSYARAFAKKPKPEEFNG